MRVYIAEKPSVATDIAKALGGNFERKDGYLESPSALVTHCVGHILQQAEPEEYDPAYKNWDLNTLPLKLYPVINVPKPDKEKQVKTVLSLINRNDVTEIIHAGDPDDEGQLLVDEVLVYAGNKKPVKRVLISDNTLPAVKKALANLKDNRNFQGLYRKALARSVADAIYGFSMTRACTVPARAKGWKGVLSVGRVQTPLLGLIVRRYRTNQSHAASFYYTLTGEFVAGADALSANWKASENAPLDDKQRLTDKKWADGLAQSLTGKQAVVKAAAVDLKQTAAPLPFNLDRLQQYMNKKHKMTAQKTLDITQQLRERHKAITYNRSDCSYLSEEQYAASPALINALTKIGDFSGITFDSTLRSKAFNDAEVTAHTAIIPTTNVPDLTTLSEQEKLVYMAIARYFLVQFLTPKQYKEALAVIQCCDETFQARAIHITSEGFTSFLTDKDDEDSDDDVTCGFDIISKLRTGNDITCNQVIVNEKKTTPPALFTEASLLSAMVNIASYTNDDRIKKLLKEKDKGKKKGTGGLGTPATRAGHIEVLKKRGYVDIVKGKFIPTKEGEALFDALPDTITNPDLTALWSEKQIQIENDDISIDDFVNALYDDISDLLKRLNVNDMNIKTSPQKQDGQSPRLTVKCPVCNNDIIVRPKLYACSGCEFKIWKSLASKSLTDKQVETIISKGISGEIKGFTSKTGKTFSAKVKLEDKATGKLSFEFLPKKD